MNTRHINPAAAQALPPPRMFADHNAPGWVLSLVQIVIEMERRQTQMAKTLEEILAQGRETLAQIKANADLDRSIYDALKQRDDRLAELTEQLKAAGTDPAKLAELAALMDELTAAANAERDASVEAIKASTPAAPADPAPPADPNVPPAEPVAEQPPA